MCNKGDHIATDFNGIFLRPLEIKNTQIPVWGLFVALFNNHDIAQVETVASKKRIILDQVGRKYKEAGRGLL
jgi:hypothetical protein